MNRPRAIAAVAAIALLAGPLTGCGDGPGQPKAGPAVTILMGGDVMLGRRVGAIAAAQPDELFADVKVVIRAADVALANLESPLTHRPHAVPNPNALEADPTHIELVAEAGFDVLSIANNHAGDAGPGSVTDTIAYVTGAGMAAVGGGTDRDAAWTPYVVEVEGIRLAILAIDVSGDGLAAGHGPGVAAWDPARAEDAMRDAAARADVVIVSIHGGMPEWQGTDPQLAPVARQLASWGADIVWGHGPHVGQPVVTVDGGAGRRSLVATSLGNLLFDQQLPPNSTGLLLEAMVDSSGLVAWRSGTTRNDDLRAHFVGWQPPTGDAALLGGEWWSLVRHPALERTRTTPDRFPHGDVIAAATGDVTGDGTAELLVAYRHPRRQVDWDPRPVPTDESGRSAHVGVFHADATPLWRSRRPPHPVGDVVACSGSAAFGYTTFESPDIVATSAGIWNGFGFTLGDELPGPGQIGCADVDGDDALDPVVLGRSG